MVLSGAESVMELWDTWHIEGMIILVLLLHSFLSLFAPSRKMQGGKWGICLSMSISLAYFLVNWAAAYAFLQIMFDSERSDIQVFWASFLLLYLGGPDSITSYTLEDNELWKRHLFWLFCYVGLFIHVVYQSLPNNKLLLPTLRVLVTGIIKYAERIYALYLASFPHFGKTWAPCSSETAPGIALPEQFLRERNFNQQEQRRSMLNRALIPFGTIMHPLLGTTMPENQRKAVLSTILQLNSDQMLLILQINLSLLVEALHTKLPVVDCKNGYVCRTVKLACLFGALFSFLSLEKHCKLEKFDIWLTYGLLIHALTLEFIDAIFLIFSDWFFITRIRNIPVKDFNCRQRWCNSVSQLDFFTYLVKDYPVWFNKLANFLGIKSMFEDIRGLRYQYSKDFTRQLWSFIYGVLRERYNSKTMQLQTSSNRCVQILRNANLDWSIKGREFVKTLLTWCIATEICLIKGQNRQSEGIAYHRERCMLLSKYMFYLVVMEPTVMASISADWKKEFEQIWNEAKRIWGDMSDEVDFTGDDVLLRIEESNSMLSDTCRLVRELNQQQGGCPWELMSKVWVEFVCCAAIKSEPNIHSRLLSRGGELLTLVWLSMYYLRLIPPKAW